MRIEEIILKNIGAFRNEQKIIFNPRQNINKAEIHIFTGNNGTGKSTLLHALTAGFNYDNSENGVCRFTSNDLHLRMQKDISEILVKTSLCSDHIRTFKCPNGAKHLHIDTTCEEIKNYYTQLGDDWDINYEHTFALFAYPSHRLEGLQNFRYDIPNKRLENPLFDSLEFNKAFNPKHNLKDWIRDIILKNAYKKNENLPNITEYSDILDRITFALSNIMEQKISFVLDERLENTLFRFENTNDSFTFEVLAEGIKCLLSWIVDVCYRLDKLTWQENKPILERPFVLFLDEADVHLHIRWQRLLLPIVEDLFPKAQIFLTTHSPFIVNSIDGAWVYELDLDNERNSRVTKIKESDSGNSYQNIIRETFEVSRFSDSLEKDLKIFNSIRDSILLKKEVDEKGFLENAMKLANRNDDVKNIVLFELRQLSKKTGKEFVL